jgi:hypothetical protein
MNRAWSPTDGKPTGNPKVSRTVAGKPGRSLIQCEGIPCCRTSAFKRRRPDARVESRIRSANA